MLADRATALALEIADPGAGWWEAPRHDLLDSVADFALLATQLRAHSDIRVRRACTPPVASAASLECRWASAACDADNAVDDEKEADHDGHDRKGRRAGMYESISQVRQTCFGLPRAPGEVQEDHPNGGCREEGEGQEGEDDDEERRMVAHENHGDGGGQRPGLLQDPDGGCFPRMEMVQPGSELVGDP